MGRHHYNIVMVEKREKMMMVVGTKEERGQPSFSPEA